MLYTELLTEYVANNGGAANAFPALFDEVPDFGDANFRDTFMLRYCGREIGFETEELFALRLEGKAQEVIPRYLQKIENIKKYTALSGNIIKTYKYGETSKRTPDLTVKNDGGEVVTDNYNYPDNGATLPASNSLSGETRVKDESGVTTTGTEKNERGGQNEEISTIHPREQQEIISAEIELKNVYTALLDEFEPLFMQVL